MNYYIKADASWLKMLCQSLILWCSLILYKFYAVADDDGNLRPKRRSVDRGAKGDKNQH